MDRMTRLTNVVVAVRKYENPTPITKSAPIKRCLSSVRLNPKCLAVLGVYETVYLYEGCPDHLWVVVCISLGALALHASGQL